MIFWMLLFVVLTAPLALGAVFAWAWGGLAIAAGVLLFLWSLGCLAGRIRPAVGPGALWPVLLCYGLVLLWIWLQSVPWTPPAWHHPLWRQAALALESDVAGAISLAPDETRSGLVRFFAYGALFWLALQYGRDIGRARTTLRAVALVSGLFAAYGLVLHLGGVEQILWIEKASYRGSLTGTFVNRNSMAAFAGLGLIAATGLLLEATQRAANRDVPWRRRIALQAGALFGRVPLFLVAWMASAGALLLTGSRGGIAATLLGIATLFAVARRRSAFPLALTAILGLLAAALFLHSGADLAQRLGTSADALRERAQVYALSLSAVAERPLLGHGLGSFADVFQIHRDDGFDQTFEKAHNSYLEAAVELGVPATALLCFAIAWLFVRCLKGARARRRDGIHASVALAATIAVAAHALVDFSLQVPAVAALYVLLLGSGTAQSWSSRDKPGLAPQSPSNARNISNAAAAEGSVPNT